MVRGERSGGGEIGVVGQAGSGRVGGFGGEGGGLRAAITTLVGLGLEKRVCFAPPWGSCEGACTLFGPGVGTLW